MPKKKESPKRPDDIDALASMLAEIDEAVALWRPRHPTASEHELRHRAEATRAKRYETGRWPTLE